MFVDRSSAEVPRVSVIVTANGALTETLGCLRALVGIRDSTTFEVVVAAARDDAAEDRAALETMPELGLVPIDDTAGSALTGNLGAEAARGEILVFLAADTVVGSSWLDPLVRTLDADPSVGQVGSMILAPDGTVLDAGGIVFADGRSHRYGRGDDPTLGQYLTPRDVDHCSGASFAIRAAVFHAIGGFDSRYAPAHYEDVDLSFSVRAHGHRTVVEPDSLVIRLEGADNDQADHRGLQRFRDVNRQAFVSKWRRELTDHGSAERSPDIWQGRHRAPRGMFLICEPDAPEPDRDAGSRRLLAMIQQIQQMGFAVYLIAANERAVQPYARDLRRLGVTLLTDPPTQRRFLAEAGSLLSAVMLCRPGVAHKYLEDVFRYCPDALVLFDTVDLHGLRAKRQSVIEHSRTGSRLADHLWFQERTAIESADVVFVVSPVEQKILAELVPDTRVEVLSNIHEPVDVDVTPLGRTGMTFVGNYHHLPNRDATRWFIDEILPLVRAEVPDAFVRLIGSHMPADLVELQRPGVEVVGWVADLAPVYRASRVVIAPLRYGAGIKGKVLEALEYSVPMVLTPVAAEGIVPQRNHATTGANPALSVRPDAQSFARGCIELLTDDDQWRTAAAAGGRDVLPHFSTAAARATLERVLRVVPLRRSVPMTEQLGVSVR